MSTAYLRTLAERRATLTDAGTAVLDECAEKGADPTPEQRAQLDKWDAEASKLDAEIAVLETRVRAGANFANVLDRIAGVDEATERRNLQRRENPEPPVETRSIGEQFTASDEFKAYQGGGSSRKVEFGGFLVERRAAIDTTMLSIPAHQWSGPAGPTYSAPLLNVIGREVVSSGNVEYMTWSDPSAAAEVAEGALKPEATFAPTEANVPLKTYAHWKAITRQALEDMPRIQSIVDGKLRRGLAIALQTAAAAALNAATTFTPVATDDLYKGIRLAVGEVQSSGYAPNAVLLNPADFADLDINSAADANNGPTGFTSYWGVTPVPVPDVAAGTAYVGDFKEAITWFDRNKAAVYLTDSHADYFIRNLLVVLAETRAAFAVTDGPAAAKVTVTAPLGTRAAAAK